MDRRDDNERYRRDKEFQKWKAELDDRWADHELEFICKNIVPDSTTPLFTAHETLPDFVPNEVKSTTFLSRRYDNIQVYKSKEYPNWWVCDLDGMICEFYGADAEKRANEFAQQIKDRKPFVEIGQARGTVMAVSEFVKSNGSWKRYDTAQNRAKLSQVLAGRTDITAKVIEDVFFGLVLKGDLKPIQNQ
ncbi:MAG: DUF5069 domain-containing protein [Thaumarchaeota archaeon]|nr:DUF5069 domain-containing protein [Nitrososphaerota archaeon]